MSMGFYVLFVALLGAVSALVVLPLLQYVMGAALLAFVLFPAHERLVGTRIGSDTYGLTIGGKLSAGILTAIAIVGAIVPILFFTAVIFQTVQSFARELQNMDIIPTIESLAEECVVITDEMLEDIESQLLAEIEQLLESAIQYLVQELVGLLILSDVIP